MSRFKKRSIVFAFFFIALITLPVILFQYFNFLLEPVSKNKLGESVIFVIPPGQPLGIIAQNLKEKNLIKNSFAFRLLVAQMGIGKSIQFGDYKLSPAMSATDIAKELTHGAIDVWITLPEGLRVEEEADKIEQKLKFGGNDSYNFDKKEFIKLAKEGYMFPDTYLIPKDATSDMVIQRLLDTFKQKVSDSILDKATNKKMTNEDVIILASLIERESRTVDEKPIIAGIIINRLKKGMALDIDATVQYAKGFDSANSSWWPQITQEDYKSVKSPFNTYLNQGLPPSPIANPGIDSIRAAISPAQTEYYFYLHDADGKVHFAKTAQEHNQNINKFL